MDASRLADSTNSHTCDKRDHGDEEAPLLPTKQPDTTLVGNVCSLFIWLPNGVFALRSAF
jgi:hypothetical protein